MFEAPGLFVLGDLEAFIQGLFNKDAGTLNLLCNLTNKRNVLKDPSKRVVACEILG